ncbi:unnamed protein product, partial [Ectocarpus sp. 12 AP-2014]
PAKRRLLQRQQTAAVEGDGGRRNRWPLKWCRHCTGGKEHQIRGNENHGHTWADRSEWGFLAAAAGLRNPGLLAVQVTGRTGWSLGWLLLCCSDGRSAPSECCVRSCLSLYSTAPAAGGEESNLWSKGVLGLCSKTIVARHVLG